MNSQATRKRKCVVRQHDEVHAGEIGREERQHAQRRGFVPAVAERVEARGGAAEIGDDQKEGGERIEAKIRPDAGQADRQRSASPAPMRDQRCRSTPRPNRQGWPAGSRHRPRPSPRTNGRPRRRRPRPQAIRPRTKVRQRPALFANPNDLLRAQASPRQVERLDSGSKKHESAGNFNKRRPPSTGLVDGGRSKRN